MSIVLCILDGWGIAEDNPCNAISAAFTPCWDAITSKYPSTALDCSGNAVGLPDGYMGNSEVGHLTIGSGRRVKQSLAILNDGLPLLHDNDQFNAFISAVSKVQGKCHVMGLLSPGGVHSHSDHLQCIIEAVKFRGVEVCLHAFLDGRDTLPYSALEYVKGYDITTLSGRYYSMDRDKRWNRVKQAYSVMVNSALGAGISAEDAIKASYDKEISDEFFVPIVLKNYEGMNDGDAFIMVNYRFDRVIQILSALLGNQPFSKSINFSAMLGMMHYLDSINIESLFSKQVVTNTLGDVIALNNMSQLRVAESEKSPHVTFFFDGCKEAKLSGAASKIIPSPSVEAYNLIPEMSANAITDEVIANLGNYDVIIMNYANADMVGHSGCIKATMKAVEEVDRCVARLKDAVLASNDILLITADHGNAEAMYDYAIGSPNTAHTVNAVPFVCVSNDIKIKLKDKGELADIAPSVLKLLNIKKPAEMKGRDLFS